ncbi:MAG TPA: TonB-dependent receptor [Lunatimonas sp.]|nr:TonB-dependent receptor [Lunatimonas sp.]
MMKNNYKFQKLERGHRPPSNRSGYQKQFGSGILKLCVSILVLMVGLAPLVLQAEENSGSIMLENRIADITISGKVVDPKGEPIPGATISIPGTSIGAVTDMDGDYSITVPEGSTLVFSFIGFESTSIEVGNQTIINVTLSEGLSSLDEVVVVGYGTVKRSDLTGSVVSVSMDDVPPAANMNLMQALRGFSPGLNVQGGARAGGEPSFSIRGQNTLSASQRPLIVLDGIIFNGAISDINVADVEQIDVLKDASAAAIYGSRAANGVIIVTTKKGTSKEPTININSYYGVQDYTNHPVRMMNADQYVTKLIDYTYMQSLYGWYGQNPTSVTDNGGRPVYPERTDNLVLGVLQSEDERANYLAGNELNWVDEITRTAPVSNTDLSIGGSGDRFSYYVSGSFTDQKGVQVNDQFKRTTLNSKIEGKLVDWVTVGLNTLYSYRDHSGIEASMLYARNASPLASKYDENGVYPALFNDEFLMRHPLSGELSQNEELRKNLFATAYTRIDVPMIEGLTYEFNYSNNQNTVSNNTFHPSTVYDGLIRNGQAIINNSNTTDWVINNIVNYSTEFAERHRLSGTFVYTTEKSFGNSNGINAVRFSNEILGYNNVGFAEQPTISSGAWEEGAVGYMGRFSYVYDNRYLLTGTFRRDGFSGFGENNKFANFPSVSAAWTLSEEDFMDGTNGWLDFMKFRVSYGENGNQGIGRYSSLTRMGVLDYVFGASSAIGIGPTTLGNSLLGWETTRSTNFGIDYILFNDRISGEIDFYVANTDNVLVTRSLPGATGFNNVWTNIGGIENKGVELELRTVNVISPVRWESRFVFALNRDKIVDLYGDGKDDIGNQWFIGHPISAIFDYKRAGGVWTEEQFFNGETHRNFYPGQFRLEDINGDNQINPAEDRQIVGYATPNYRFSIGNNLYYQNFTFSFTLNSIQGGNGYYIQNNRALLEATSDFDYANRINMPAIRENWTPFNGVSDAPAVYNYPTVTSGNYQDRSFVRLQDVSLSYRFNQRVLDNLKVKNLQAYLSGQNLYTWTNFQGFDPEIGGVTDLMMRNLILGVKLSF